MMKYFYTGLIRLYLLGIWIATWFNPKAKRWYQGRQEQNAQWKNINTELHPVWFHCSSLGEFEQARPIIEFVHEKMEAPILLTFFSPSGFEIRKDYVQADYVFYLPIDLPKKVNEWLDRIQPRWCILTKYDFWWNYIAACEKRKIPVILIAALFRPDQYFFKNFGSYFRERLKKLDRIFVQNEQSYDILKNFEFDNIALSGDTRLDQVLSIAQNPTRFPVVEQFAQNSKVLVVGSSWPMEEQLVADWIGRQSNEYKLIIAPHDVSRLHIGRIQDLFDEPVALWSEGQQQVVERILIVDSIGILVHLYQYAWVVLIGGGFRKNIHNILEPLAYKKPVLIGPNYQNFPEANQLVMEQGVYVIRTLGELTKQLEYLDQNELYVHTQQIIKNYLVQNQGASQDIFEYLQHKYSI